MDIRPARSDDVPALAGLAQETYSQAFGHSLTPEDLSAHLAGNLSAASLSRIIARDTVLIATEGHLMVGFVQFGAALGYPEAVSQGDRAVDKLYVHADYRGRGIGGLLLNTALEHLHRDGAKRVFLDVWEHNPGALRFYRRYGFTVVGTRGFEVASGAETSLDLVMMRQLGSSSA